jgi:hypothetical protein
MQVSKVERTYAAEMSVRKRKREGSTGMFYSQRRHVSGRPPLAEPSTDRDRCKQKDDEPTKEEWQAGMRI